MSFGRRTVSLIVFFGAGLLVSQTALWAQQRPPRCAYVANNGSSGSGNTISAYTVNATSGALTFVGVFTTNPGPNSLTVDPTGQFLYVPSLTPVIDPTGQVAGPITVYRINSDCTLTATSQSLVSNAEVALSVAISSDATGRGQFAYASMFPDGGLAGYTVNPATGALSPRAQPPTFPTGMQPSGIAVDRNNKFVYSVNEGSNDISGLTINPTSGALTPIVGSPFGAGSAPVSIVIHPTNHFAYVANLVSQDIWGYTIDPLTGALTKMSCSPFGGGMLPFSPIVPTSNNPIAMHPSGNFLYAATTQGVFLLFVDTSGGSTAGCLNLQSVPAAPAASPSTIAVDPTGSSAYVTDYVASSIASYSVNESTGALMPIPGSATQTGPGPIFVTTTPGSSAPCRAALDCRGADFDGDGKADMAIWRPSNGNWFIIPSSNPSAPIIQQWGTQGDIPVTRDYDGDGKTDFAVWRPSTGTWFIIPSSNPSAPIVKQWGTQGDMPVPGDYDGDGKTDFAVWRPSNGTWFIIPTSNPSAPIVQQWGTVGDIPVPVDYDGDRKTDIAVWRASNGVWYIISSTTPTNFTITQWGTNGDVPVQKPIGQ